MTEKRFKQMNGEFAHSFIDTEDTSISYICDNENDCKNIVDLLNEQHEEIQQSKELIKTYYNENSDLIKENEQLKQQLADVDRLIDEKIEEYLNIPSLSDGALTVLKELKKELKGDV